MRELKKEKVFDESLEGEEGTYHKSEGMYVETVGFWLRFISKHFIPCEECQKRLVDLIENFEKGDEMHIGNTTEPPIELYRKFLPDDNAWRDIETRPSTAKEKVRLKNSWFA